MKQNQTNSTKSAESISPETGLTAQQEKGAILLASGIRITDVAKELGTSRGTLYRWQNQIAFQCFFNMMKKDVKNFVEGNLLGLHKEALDAIRASLSSDNEAIRLKASMWVVDKIAQIQVGNSDVRNALKEQSWDNISWYDEAIYEDALEKAGLAK